MCNENTTKTLTTMAGNSPVVSEYVEVSNELESTLNKVRDATDLYNETLSANKIAMKSLMDMYKISADDKAKVQAEIDSLKAAIEKTNIESMTDAEIDELKAGKERFMNVAQPVFTKMYEAQNPNAGAGPQAGPQGDAGQQNYQNNNDDVVDGDYTEV